MVPPFPVVFHCIRGWGEERRNPSAMGGSLPRLEDVLIIPPSQTQLMLHISEQSLELKEQFIAMVPLKLPYYIDDMRHPTQLLQGSPLRSSISLFISLFAQLNLILSVKFRTYSSNSQLHFKMMLIKVVLGLCLLQLALTDADTTITIDFNESFRQGKTLEMVERVVDIGWNFNLVPDNQWTRLQDMSIIFDLSHPQYVEFAYNINFGGTGPCILATRLEVDGKEDRMFRSHLAYIQYPFAHRSGKLYLQTGRHQAVVWYRSNCILTWNPSTLDWPAAVFKAYYHRIVNSS